MPLSFIRLAGASLMESY